MKLQALSKRSGQWTLALIIAATAITGTIVFYGISQSRQTSTPEPVAKATPPERKITALGRLEPVKEVIKVSVPATLSNDSVTKLLVQRGDRVKAGQVIAIMDAQNRLQNALLEAQAQVKISQIDLAKVKAGAKSGEIAAQKAEIVRLQEQLKGEIATQQSTIARWQAEVRNANSNYNRYLSLYKQGATAALDRDQKQLARETALSQLNEAKAKQNQSVETIKQQIRQAKDTLNKIAEVRPVDVLSAQAEVDKDKASVNKAKADLAQAYIRAPMAGRILDIYAKPGEVVGVKGIADLGQTDDMQVVTEVYQTDISKIRLGQQAVITSESFPGQVHGTVRLIGLQVIQQEVTSGKAGENLDRRVIQVRIQLNRENSQRVAHLTNLQVQVAIQPTAPSTNSQ
ncbi:MAG: biotin/lipoyl-binding protein [Brasilonema octagenarum HA4186-MV1]|jgi:HlyD family secretion protein|nr:biotin/lipoyl-binding protein [Brasilonema octagenarum HA4186-MV1]